MSLSNSPAFEAPVPEVGVSRRALLARAALLPAWVTIPLAACTSQSDNQGNGLEHRDFLADVSGLLIPRTDTPGADALFVWAADAALNAIYVGMDDATFAMVGLIRDDLDARTGGDYLHAPFEQRYHALEAMDAAAFAAAEPLLPLAVAWRKIKGLLLLGYYTSEAGASQELVYQLVPGRFDPDLPVTSATRACSNDWFGVSLR